MKRLLFVTLFFIILGIGIYFFFFHSKRNVRVSPLSNIKPTKVEEKPAEESIFVPSWNLFEDERLNNYSTLIYFGVTANTNGIVTSDEGYKNIDSFMQIVPSGKKTLLVVKMLDSNTNFDILSDVKIQKKIIDDSLTLAKDNGFDGVVLDLELFSLFNDKIRDQISSFDHLFYSTAKMKQMSYYLTVYGDVYYRQRPYDMKFLSDNTDGIMLMAYDLHKSSGEPGPNFPLQGKEKYGYDLHALVDDIRKDVDLDKVTVIFGMYGYDWTTDEKGRPITRAKALSTKDMIDSFVTKCEWKNCLVRRDQAAAEMEVDYVKDYFDSNIETNPEKYVTIIYHAIWFEDDASMVLKKNFLKQQGIHSFSYWVWGYF